MGSISESEIKEFLEHTHKNSSGYVCPIQLDTMIVSL